MKLEDILKNSPKTRKGYRRFWYEGEYYALAGVSRTIRWNGTHWNTCENMSLVLRAAGVEYEQPNG